MDGAERENQRIAERRLESAVKKSYVPRRERIATAVLAGFASQPDEAVIPERGEAVGVAVARAQRAIVVAAIQWADALIAELDKEG